MPCVSCLHKSMDEIIEDLNSEVSIHSSDMHKSTNAWI